MTVSDNLQFPWILWPHSMDAILSSKVLALFKRTSSLVL